MKKFKQVLTAILFFSFVLTFSVFTIVREKGTTSYQENRRLAEMPDLNAYSLVSGSLVPQLGSYIADHFAGRSYWLNVRSFIDTNVGERVVNGVYIADNMLLGINDSENMKINSFTDAVNQFSDDYAGTLYFAAVPTSTGVYGEMLPVYMNVGSEKNKIDELYENLGNSVRKIDTYNILKMLNDNYIYYRNDSKWTSYGAYCVYRTVIQKLGFSPIAYDHYTIEHTTGDFRGNLYNKSQYRSIKADMLDIYDYSAGSEIVSCTAVENNGKEHPAELYDKNFIGTNDMYKLYLGESAPLIHITTNVNNERKLLVIKDDYADCFIPFLTQHYSEICVISPDVLTKELSSFIDKNDYEQALFIYGIENISDETAPDSINK